jgi:selenoprotein W-related protein
MTDELLQEFEPYIASWTLVPGRGGAYEVSIDDEVIFSKKALGRHAEVDEIRKLLQQRITKQGPDFTLA